MKPADRLILPDPMKGPAQERDPAFRSGPAPTDPNALLVRQKTGSSRRRPTLLIAVILGIAAAEMFAPATWKPSQIAGNAAARFYFSIMAADNVKRVELIELEIATQRLAEREAEYSAWVGRCDIAGLFDPQIGIACHQAAEAFYAEAIADARRARDRLNDEGLR